MREDSLDEFEAVFEQASIPVLEIQKVVFREVGVVLRDHALDNSALDVAQYLRKRFGSELVTFFPTAMPRSSAENHAEAHGASLAESGYGSSAELIGQVALNKLDLVIDPVLDGEGGDSLDALIESTAPPILILRKPVIDTRAMFSHVLHSLTGNFQQSENFSCSFSLAESGGRVLLLHAINESEMIDIREALQAARHVDDRTSSEVLEEMSHHGERFLKGVVAATRSETLDVSYRLSIGAVDVVVREALANSPFGLLVIGCHSEGKSHVSADDYRLIHSIHEVPILAL
ncbi:MAG: hypothetical protein ACYTHJ_14720 [Planctomycetota bacterium]